MGFGGPVWHASVAPKAKAYGRDYLAKIAVRELRGVGDPEHEWRHWSGVAYHFRRRLTVAETAIAGNVCDLRKTQQGLDRFIALRPVLPQRIQDAALMELGEQWL